MDSGPGKTQQKGSEKNQPTGFRGLQITLEVPGTQRACAEAALMDAGALAVTLEDAGDQTILEPAPDETPDWDRVRVAGLFGAEVDTGKIRATLETRFATRAAVSRPVIPATAPATPPRKFGRRLWVTPSPDEPLPESSVRVLLGPGLAFGTGSHPSTALCLDWLDAHPPLDLSVVDYGCGSGILGIAAAKLGAANVVGVDHDPQALTASRDNAWRNHCLNRFTLQATDAPAPPRVDLLLANIVARPLLELGERFARWLPAGGRIVLAGLLAEQSDAVRAFYLRWFDLDDETGKDGWILVSGTRRAGGKDWKSGRLTSGSRQTG